MYDIEQEIEKKRYRLNQSHRCKVYRLKCERPEDLEEINRFALLEEEQRLNFELNVNIKKQGCYKKKITYYVAFDDSTRQICGICQTNQNKNFLYIEYLTSRSSTDSAFRGVGTLLLDTVIIDAYQDKKINFIYLYSAFNATDFYEKYGLIRLGSQPFFAFAVKQELAPLMTLSKDIHENNIKSFERSIEILKLKVTNFEIWFSILTYAYQNQTEEIFEILAISQKKLFKKYIIDILNYSIENPILIERIISILYKRVPYKIRSKVAVITADNHLLNNLSDKEFDSAILTSLDYYKTEVFEKLIDQIPDFKEWFRSKSTDYRRELLETLVRFPKYEHLFFRLKGYVSLRAENLIHILLSAVNVETHTELIDFVLQNPKFQNIDMDWLLMIAAIRGKIEHLILKGLESDWWKSLDDTDISRFICQDLERGSIFILKYLEEKGNPPKLDRCMLNSSIRGNLIELVNFLNQEIPFDSYSLDEAIKVDNLDLVKEILDKGVRGTNSTWTIALSKNNPNIIKILMKYPLKINISHIAEAINKRNIRLADWFSSKLKISHY